MVNLTIDGKKISVEENTTIMEAAASNGVPIPQNSVISKELMRLQPVVFVLLN